MIKSNRFTNHLGVAAMFRRSLLAAAVLACLAAVLTIHADEPAKKAGADSELWNKTVTKGIDYLKSSQSEDGSWSKDKNPGVTGIVVTGLLETGKVNAREPFVAKGLKYIESLINPKAGHIAGKDPKVQLQNYVTSVNVMALVAADRESYKQVIGDAVKFLKKLQWDEEEGKNPSDDYYGGAGYDSQSRPDLSNTQFFLDALKAAGVPKDDPALKKAMIFVSRCQNLKGETNDQPWAGRVNDGSFIYSAANGGQTKVADNLPPDAPIPGYGSMTYAGIKSLIYCGASKDDPRIKKAYEWIQKNYTVEENPGMPKIRSQWGLYYYYHSMAKCLDTLGIDEVVDSEGKKHDWRADITAALAKRQKDNGSWVNENHWLEADPNLVTGYALMTLGYCKPKK
ncbi:MAG TPA: prenyltransferase/squalene oxidase repeat-containing protein [Gemmataceae bacterium]|nr:prenyltransferase/squalene oxidase repeat-containing protein [Gemmataceae bacterium]